MNRKQIVRVRQIPRILGWNRCVRARANRLCTSRIRLGRFHAKRALAGLEIPHEIQSFLSLAYENKCHEYAISEEATTEIIAVLIKIVLCAAT